MAKKSLQIPHERLNKVMGLLHINAVALGEASSVDHSLISKWQQGVRPVSRRSSQLPIVCDTLVRLDTGNVLDDLATPYRQSGEGKADALLSYLVTEQKEGLELQPQRPERKQSGVYMAQYRVFLGQKGFRQAGLETLDYALTLPPSTLTVLAQGRFEWFTGSIPYLLRFLRKLKKVFKHGTRMQMINRRGYSLSETAAFAGPWMVAHLKGYIRSRYYDGDMPENIRFVASIKDYWSLRAEEDPEVEDNLYLAMYTDLRETRKDAATCEEYIEKSELSSQYQFLEYPHGEGEDKKLWKAGTLPAWEGGNAPDGSFFAASCVPCFGVMTKEEFAEICGEDEPPALPGYLFSEDGGFAKRPHRIILCREDIKEGLKAKRRKNEPLSMLLHRRAFITSDMLAAQLRRLIEVMKDRDDFEVALMPKSAFQKLQLEMVCWQNSAMVGWLQDSSASVFANDKATSGALHGSIDYTWNKMLAGWKRKNTVLRQFNKWLSGKDLDKQEEDSAVVKNWDVLPKE